MGDRSASGPAGSSSCVAELKIGLRLVVLAEVFLCEWKGKMYYSSCPRHLWDGYCILVLQVDFLEKEVHFNYMLFCECKANL